MPALKTIRMTLTGGLEGKTIKLNNHQFIKGVAEYTGQEQDIEGITTYFTKSYHVKVTDPSLETEPKTEPKTEKDNKAVREDDRAVLGDVPPKTDDPETANDPNERQAEIIAAVNLIEKDQWIEQDTNPHPRVADVAEVMGDPTVSKAEICEVIQKWLS